MPLNLEPVLARVVETVDWQGGGESPRSNCMYDVSNYFLLDEYHQRTLPAYVIDTSLVRILAPVPWPETTGPLIDEQTQRYMFHNVRCIHLPNCAYKNPP